MITITSDYNQREFKHYREELANMRKKWAASLQVIFVNNKQKINTFKSKQ